MSNNDGDNSWCAMVLDDAIACVPSIDNPETDVTIVDDCTPIELDADVDAN